MLDTALKYYKSGLKVIPFWRKQDEIVFPLDYAKYKQNQEERDVVRLFSTASADVGIAILCEDGLEAIDIDIKYVVEGDVFWEELKKEISENETAFTAFYAAVIEKTKLGGYHIVYRVEGDNVPGSHVLAARAVTPEMIQKAQGKIKPVERSKAIIETRGKGGLLFVAPSDGYEVIHGSFENLKTISRESRDELISICRSFNTFFENKEEYKAGASGQLPSELYNNSAGRDGLVFLLESHGWTVVRSKDHEIRLNRPGAKHRRNVDGTVNLVNGKWLFHAFSTSTPFDTTKGYTAAGVLCVLDYNGDWGACVKALVADGFSSTPADPFPPFSPRSDMSVFNEENAESIADIWLKKRFLIANTYDVNACSYIVQGIEKTPLAAWQGILAVVGREKSGKSIFGGAAVASALNNACVLNLLIDMPEGANVVSIDTEQPDFWWAKQQRSILALAKANVDPPNYFAFPMKTAASAKELRKAITAICDRLQPKLIIIDGALDVCDNFNNEEKAMQAVYFLQNLAIKNNALVVALLHMGRSSKDAIGHLGSYLQRRADAVVGLNEDDGIFKVTPLFMRGRKFEAFEFIRGEDGLPRINNLPPPPSIDADARIQGRRISDDDIPF